MHKEYGLLGVILLLVVDEGFQTWSSIGAAPFEDLNGISKEKLKKHQLSAMLFGSLFGLLGSIAVENYTPLVVALMFNGGLWMLYQHEWEKDNA